MSKVVARTKGEQTNRISMAANQIVKTATQKKHTRQTQEEEMPVNACVDLVIQTVSASAVICWKQVFINKKTNFGKKIDFL